MAETKNPVGRPRNIQDPDQLWELFERYKLATKQNPRSKAIPTQTGVSYIPLEVPLTVVGFYAYCRNEVGSVHDYFEKPSVYPEFSGICRDIRESVQIDQIEGGMVGIYNPSITQRLNGLSDKQEHEHKGGSAITIEVKDMSK